MVFQGRCVKVEHRKRPMAELLNEQYEHTLLLDCGDVQAAVTYVGELGHYCVEGKVLLVDATFVSAGVGEVWHLGKGETLERRILIHCRMSNPKEKVKVLDD